MARTFYSTVLCLTLVMLATMWLRPGVAQDLIDMARGVRAQSPDSGFDAANPQVPGTTPYSNVPGPPTQPMPAVRPNTWPGAPATANAGVTSSSQPQSGVTVWDPNGYRNPAAAGTPAAPTNAQPSPYGARPNSTTISSPSSLSPLPPTPNFLNNRLRSQPADSANAAAPPPSVYQQPTSALPAFQPAPGGYISPNSQPQAQQQRAFLPNATTERTGQAGMYPPASAPPMTAMLIPPATAANSPGAQTPLPPATAANSPADPTLVPYATAPAPQAATPDRYAAALPPQSAMPVAGAVEQPGADPAVAPGQPPEQTNTQMQSLQVLPGAPRDFADAQVVAKVGSEAILASDVKRFVQDIVDQKKIEVPPDQKEQFFAGAARPVLKQVIEIKLVYNDCIHSIPKEALGKIQSSVNEEFDKSQLPKLLKDNDVTTRPELEAKLRSQGRSLDAMRRTFFERVMQGQWLQEKVKTAQDPALSELLGYYEQHHSEYEFAAQARWEELMVSYDKFPDKAAAWAAIVEMGNRVMQGAPLADVAKASSQGFTADQGGANDWTTRGSLACKELDEALFALPVGSLSKIIKSERGFHIIRVVERKNAGRKPFEETQAEIKKQLKSQASEKQFKKYLDDLRQKTPIWTIYDTEPGGIDGPKDPQSGS